MKAFLFFLALSAAIAANSQLAKLTTTGEQEYRLNIKRGGMVVTPFTKAIRSTVLGDIIEDSAGGYLQFKVIKGGSGSTKKGAYVHFMKLDRKLNIKSENETHLIAEGSENMQPVSAYRNGNFLYLITAGPDTEMSNFILTYWQFDISTLSLLKKNVSLVTLPFNKNKEYDFRTFFLKNDKGFVMTLLEEAGKKENSVLHCLSFSENLAPGYKRSITLPFAADKGTIAETIVDNEETVYCLLTYPHEKNENIILNSLLVSTKEKNVVLDLKHGEGNLINGAIGLSAKNGLLFSGLIWPGKKDYCYGLVLGKVTPEGKMEITKEESFAASLLDVLEKSDKQGLKTDYYIRSITQRDNGVTDVVLNYVFKQGGWSSAGALQSHSYSSSVEISDAVILSYDKNQLVSTIPIKRNLEENTTRGSYGVNRQKFSIPRVFTKSNDLYVMYFDNPSNTIGANDGKKPKWTDFSRGSLVLAKIDEKYKPLQQELILFDKDGDFRSFYELSVKDINEKRYILRTDKYGYTRNVKTVSILLEMK